MINESTIINLLTRKIIQPIQSKCNGFKENLIPYSSVYEIMGRRGFHKSEARILGRFLQARGLIKISKHGWLIKPTTKF